MRADSGELACVDYMGWGTRIPRSTARAFVRKFSRGLGGERHVDVVDHRGAQLRDGLRVELARTRLGDTERDADLLQGLLVDVVEREQAARALGQLRDRLAETSAQLAALEGLAGRAAVDGELVERVRVHRHNRSDDAAREHFALAEARALGDFARVGGAAVHRGEVARRFVDAARTGAVAARHEVEAAEVVEDGAADAQLGVRLERSARRVELTSGVDEAERAGADEVIDLDLAGKAARDLLRDLEHEAHVLASVDGARGGGRRVRAGGG